MPVTSLSRASGTQYGNAGITNRDVRIDAPVQLYRGAKCAATRVLSVAVKLAVT